MTTPWSVEDTRKLQRWFKLAAARRDAHFAASSLNSAIGNALEFPSVLIGSITSTVALSQRQDNLVAYLSMITTLTIASNTFLGCRGKAASHLATSKAYGSLARHIESAVLRRSAPVCLFVDYVLKLTEDFDALSTDRMPLPWLIRRGLDEAAAAASSVFQELNSGSTGDVPPEDGV